MNWDDITLTNLIPDPSFETGAAWSGVTYDSTHSLYGSRSQKLQTGGAYVGSAPMIKPVAGHVYYGRHSIKTAGNSTPADCRFEWFAGDGAGLNFVFGYNRGDHPEWFTESAVIKVDQVNGTSYVCRNFVVNANYTVWADGLMIVDLTEAFGAGLEPDKAWCDQNIPFFAGTTVLEVYQTEELAVTGASFFPNPAVINSRVSMAVTVKESLRRMLRDIPYCGDIYAGEV